MPALNRRALARTIAQAAAAGVAGTLAMQAQSPPVKTLKLKITKAEPILTGSDVFLKLETDAGITGYGDATNHFLPYSVEGMLRDLVPYLIGEDPERIEYLWQVCYRRRFQRGGPSTGSALAAIDMAPFRKR